MSVFNCQRGESGNIINDVLTSVESLPFALMKWKQESIMRESSKILLDRKDPAKRLICLFAIVVK